MPAHRLLIIGVGSIGERHLRCFGGTGRCELSICEPNDDLRTAVGDRYQVSRRFSALDEALREPPEAAVIAAPAQLHVPMAARLAQAGVHLFIEKPLSITLDGIDELQRLIDKQKLKAVVGYTFRSHPVVRDLRDAIRQGRLGRIVQLVAVWGQYFPKYRPAYRQIYYTRHDMGGGAIQDSLTHSINLGEFLVGPVGRVVADAAHLVLEGVDVEDSVNVLARHGEVMASYSHNQHQAPNELVTTVIGEKATARLELHNSRWLLMEEAGGAWKEQLAFSLERDDIFINQARLFLDYLEGRGDPACTVAEGLQTLRANLAILASSRNPGWQSV